MRSYRSDDTAGASSKGDKKLVDDESKVDTGLASTATDPLGPLVPEGTEEKEEEEVAGTDPLEGRSFGS